MRFFEKLWYLKNCVSLKNCDTWKTAFLWKTCLLLDKYVTWKYFRWGALLVKYCVGVRYFKILLYCKNVALFEKWFSFLKLRYFENCVTLKNCGTRELLRWKTVLLWKTVILKNCVTLKTLIEKGFALGCVTCKSFQWIIFALLYLK